MTSALITRRNDDGDRRAKPPAQRGLPSSRSAQRQNPPPAESRIAPHRQRKKRR